MKKIPLRNKEKIIIAYALVDDEDFERLNKVSWSLQATGYPQAWEIKTSGVRTMHQHILKLLPGYKGKNEVSHINQNKLDNRKENLRLTNRQENSRNQHIAQKNNKTGYLNVQIHGKDCYTVSIFGKYYGHFDDLELAGKFAKKKREELLKDL